MILLISMLHNDAIGKGKKGAEREIRYKTYFQFLKMSVNVIF